MISLLEDPGLVVSDVEVQEDRVCFNLTNTSQNNFMTYSYWVWVELEQDGAWYQLRTEYAHTVDAIACD